MILAITLRRSQCRGAYRKSNGIVTFRVCARSGNYSLGRARGFASATPAARHRGPQGWSHSNHIKRERGALFRSAHALLGREFAILANEQTRGKYMKKLLLLPLVAIGLARVPVKE